MQKQIIEDSKSRMDRAVEVADQSLSKIRTGRAQPSLLEDVNVDYYGSMTPLKQLANIVAEDSRTLTVQPYDMSAVENIEKALRTCGLDLNPAQHGNLIRIPLPSLTEERRKEYVKVAKTESESGRISVRNIRRDVNQGIKNAVKNRLISEDEAKRLEYQIQDFTNDAISEIDLLLSKKEKELLSV